MLIPRKLSLLALSLIALIGSPGAQAELANKSAPPASNVNQRFQWDYTFGRPIKKGEVIYNDYRKKHADEAAKTMGLSAAEVGDGMDTWHWWVGVDNPGFWSDTARLTASSHNYTNLRLDLFRLLMILPRNERFEKLGLINDPDCVAGETPDQFGLKIDRMKDGTLLWDPDKFGYSSGVIGLQLFKNENFDPKKWSAEKYISGGDSIEPPYKIGMSCVFCHVGFNPLNPPANPDEPTWDNIASTQGNQYLREGMAFGLSQKDASMIYHYLATQEPGTSETSRFPTDSINNPTNINAILRLRERLKETHEERITPAQAKLIKSMYQNAGLKLDNIGGALGGTDANPTLKAPHILTDGADSMGILTASTRVYVNEGSGHNDWYDSWPVNIFDIKSSLLRGFKPREFDILGKERQGETPWVQTERRMPNMATFLMSYDSYALKDAKEVARKGEKLKNGAEYLSHDETILHTGKVVFAQNCASCHSSKRPDPMPSDAAEAKKAWETLVMKPDFLDGNYLSDDDRHSSQEIGTNVQRAMGTNAMAGWTWGQMSSQTYKDMRKPIVDVTDVDENGKTRPLYNPLSGKFDLKFKGHAAFYRTPTLVSIWATAPYFHNNALGRYTGDYTVKGRMDAFEDGMQKMLWPAKRDGIKSIKVTSAETNLPDIFPGLQTHLKTFDDMDLKILQLPAGTPVNLVMNVNPKHAPALFGAYIKGVLAGKPRTEFKSLIDRRREAGIESLKREMLKVNTCPDFIEDRGHYFGSHLSDSEKNALIEYMKYF